MTALQTAKAVLAEASLYDQSFAKPDLGVAQAWARALREANTDDALQAVAEHYAAQTRRLMVADVLDGIRRIRNDRVRRVAEDVDYDGEDVLAGIAAIRGRRAQIADQRTTGRRRPVRTLLESTATRMPKVPAGSEIARHAFTDALHAKRKAQPETEPDTQESR